MVNSRTPTALKGFLVACLSAAGCQSHESARPETAPVSGTVIYRGQPVANATVTFIGPGAARFSVGQTDAAGAFRLTTYDPDDGAIVGENVVTVVRAAEDPDLPQVSGEMDGKAYMAAMDEAARRSIAAQSAGSALPETFADPATSPLRKTVQRGDNILDLDLGGGQ